MSELNTQLGGKRETVTIETLPKHYDLMNNTHVHESKHTTGNGWLIKQDVKRHFELTGIGRICADAALRVRESQRACQHYTSTYVWSQPYHIQTERVDDTVMLRAIPTLRGLFCNTSCNKSSTFHVTS